MTENSDLAVSCPAPYAADYPRWSSQLEMAGKNLESLAGETEHQFLKVGDKLNDYYYRATEISRICSSVATAMAGKDVDDAIRGFQGLLERMQAYLAQGEAGFAEDSRVLQNVLQIIENLHKPISGFKKIVKILEILSVSTKIESAQLGREGEGFVTIADDVEKLSVLINSSFADILSRTGTLGTLVHQTLARLSGLKMRKKDKVEDILAGTRSNLASLAEKNRSSSITAERISAESGNITRSIGEVVSAMQFHDITRQQVEHSRDALEKISFALKEAGRDAQDNDAARNARVTKAAAEARVVCELQIAQLTGSVEDFTRAVDDIVGNLQQISGSVVAMHRDVDGLAGVEGEISSSFLAAIESDLSSAIEFFRETRDALRDVAEAMDMLTGTIHDMTKFVDDIEEIGTEIELIAVNARIKAAHTGAEGAPLGVIAEVIQKLSVDARVQKGAVSDELRCIITTIEGLLHDDTHGHSTETDSLLGDLADLLARLRGINQTALSNFETIQREGRKLASDIDETRNGISVQRIFKERVHKSIDVVAAVSEKLTSLAPEITGAELEALKNLSSNYTMHSERGIHDSFEKSSRTGKNGFPVVTETPQHNDFGQNVELF